MKMFSFGSGQLADRKLALFSGIFISSISAFAISYTTAWSVRVASSTTYSMVGALNKLPIAISGIVFFSNERQVTNFGNILSVIIGKLRSALSVLLPAFCSGFVYSVAQVNKKQKAFPTKILQREGSVE